MVTTKIGSLEFKNPVMTASGTYGYGREFAEFYDLSVLGAVVCKTITLKQREGNPPPRVADFACGMLNAIGLENKGAEHFVKEALPFLAKYNTKTVVSIAGSSAGEYGEIAAILDKEQGVHAIEVNMSCPNVSHGCHKGLFSQDVKAIEEIISAVRKNTKKPLFGKVSPAVADITVTAKAVEAAGADALSLVNTFPAMGVDLNTRKPLLGNKTGGLSGPAIKPIALKMVWDSYNAVKIPVIGMGGIMTAKDALEFILCGASAVQVGTANFVNPMAAKEAADGIEKYFKENNLKSIDDLKGQLKM